MTRSVVLRLCTVMACSIAMLCSSVVASAQTADAFNPGANQTIWTVAAQPDGKILVGGVFTGLGGGTGTTTRNHIGRLNADGTVDSTFNPGANGDVYAVAVQGDGKILIGGNFTAVGGGTGTTTMRSHIARLNSDGSVDTSFNPGANLNVYALAVQPDGKILVAGSFSMLGGGGTGTTTRIGLGRLDANGSLDSFNPGASKTFGAPIVYTMALQEDGKIVVGGYFNGLGGGTGTTMRNFIGRINGDGSLDTLFNPGANSISGVTALALQADGKIVVGGSFTGLGGGTGATNRQNIGRLHADGSLDTGFNPGAEAQVLTLAVQTDGKILAGGYFQLLGGGSERRYLGRLSAEGVIDATFNPGAGNLVTALAVQADGTVVAAGIFGTVGGGTGLATPRNRIARFTNTGTAIQTLTLTGGGTVASSMAWARGGTGPEVSHVTFEFSFDGSFYSLLGSGTRVPGGWQLNNTVNLPRARTVWIRARGYYGSGYQNGSGSIVESILIQMPLTTRAGDYDGDGSSDVAVFRPSDGTWYVRLANGTFVARAWGANGDIPVPGDYDGDGRTDMAVYRPSTGTWWVPLQSSNSYTATQWGTGGDIPVPSDYDGDGKTDVGVYRPSDGTWYILKSTTNNTSWTVFQWGTGGDIPKPGDYDGDGRADMAVYRPSDGTWYIPKSSTNNTTWTVFQWGASGDVPVPGRYDGDGRTDMAVFRPSTGQWYIAHSSTNMTSWTIVGWGLNGDIPVPADYDGDGRTDIGVFRPSSGVWYILNSSTNSSTILQWGYPGDVPVVQR